MAPEVTKEDIAWFNAEAERLGITPKQLAEIVVMGAADALEDAIAQWQREQAEEQTAA